MPRRSIDYSTPGFINVIDKKTGKTLVKVNPKFFRPTESNIYVGNPQKAETQLNWKREVSFEQMVEKMVQHDLDLLNK